MRRSAAFTMTELLIVIGVILILAAMVLAGLDVVTKRGYQAKCASNLKQIGAAAIAYAINNGTSKNLPGPGVGCGGELLSVGFLYKSWVSSARVLCCPAEENDSSSLTPGGTLNPYNASNPVRPDSAYGFDFNHTMFDPFNIAIGADFTGASATSNSTNHGTEKTGQNVLFVDGHVQWRADRTCGYNNDNIFTQDTTNTYDSWITQ